MSRTLPLPGTADERVEALADKLAEYKKSCKALAKNRTRCGEIKAELLEVMHAEGRKTYRDEEAGYTIVVGREETIQIVAMKAPKATKDDEE